MTHTHTRPSSNEGSVPPVTLGVSAPGRETTGPSLGPVVLDIGEAFGAAVVRTSHELDGAEIEIRRVPLEWEGTHVAVRARPLASAPVYAAVFGHLREGTYELRRRDLPSEVGVHRIEVVGGQVVETTWPEWDLPT